ncbi:hypothetical protein FDP41_001124 [Naegleria fowleri]|uniref:histone acetyltransferase n=1 Tax=Naegleria fowleri TaxID=5763 RepID=A0A6A5BZH4_NAEFO|nr:uncharacterized protein FDP41_001124 [Naegleria fowleri]KAF0979971.1 hypothetical protein FDP41_001124 [Naegleria fowleri]CAG4713379.1 unnamed protein product [Naegleria fowleri]
MTEPEKKKKKLSNTVDNLSSSLGSSSSLNYTSAETKKFNKLNRMVEEEGVEDLADYEEEDERRSNESDDDEMCVVANDVIHFRIVRNEGELDLNQQIDVNDIENTKRFLDFQPTFTHQLFGENEKIEGYENIRINIFFTNSLYCWLNIQCDSKSDDATDVKGILTAKDIEFPFSDYRAPPLYFPYTENLTEFKSKLSQPNTPKGEQIDVYYREGRCFEIYKASMSQIGVLHKPWQFLSLFFIDGTSFINDQDENWEFFLSYEKVKNTETNNFEYIPIGFSSIYPFFVMKKDGNQLIDTRRLRVSQFLILPPFQGQGHGRKLLLAIYTYATKGFKEQKAVVGYNALSFDEKTFPPRECYEVTVENPGDDFQTMRTKVDLEVCAPLFKAAKRKADETERETFEDFKKRAKPITKLSDGQLRLCFEILWLKSLNENVNTTNEERNEFKLFIKKRLYREYDMEGAFEDDEERKEKLEELYQEQVNEYKVFLK